MRWAERDNNIDLGSLTATEAILWKRRYCQTKSNTRHQQTLELFLISGRLTMDILGMKKKLNNEIKAEAIEMWCRLRGNIFELWEASCSNYTYKGFLDMAEIAKIISQAKKVW